MKKINYPLYVPGQKLEEGEYLLKLMNVVMVPKLIYLYMYLRRNLIPDGN